MGVPRYRATLSKYCPQAFYNIPKGKEVKNCDNLYIDFNPIIHFIAGNVYGYARTDESMAVDNPTDQIVFQKCWEYLVMLMEDFSPSEKVYIAIDGIAPVAKQNQQRQRRFLSAKNATQNFSSANITVGTMFMHRLYQFLRVKLTEWLDEYSSEILYSVILSSDKVPGEGEHKIINAIRGSPTNQVNYIYGPDGDLLFLTLLLPSDSYIVTDSQASYQCCDIPILKRFIGSLLTPHWGKNQKYDESVLRDYVMLCTVFGNDFLPKLKMVYSLEESWQLITKLYQEFGATGEITLVDSEGIPIKENVKEFFKSFQKYEIDHIEKQVEVKVEDEKFYDGPLDSCCILVDGKKTLFFDGYRDYYYERELGSPNQTDIKKMCDSYWNTFVWSYQYYLSGKVNWTQSYNYYEAPFLCDLLENFSLPRVVNDAPLPKDFTPFIQLACVLPPECKYLLPEEYEPFFDRGSKQYLGEKMFPSEFEYDLKGKFSDHQGVARLPFCDRDLLIQKLSNVNMDSYNRNIITTVDKWDTLSKKPMKFQCGKRVISVKNIEYTPASKL